MINHLSSFEFGSQQNFQNGPKWTHVVEIACTIAKNLNHFVRLKLNRNLRRISFKMCIICLRYVTGSQIDGGGGGGGGEGVALRWQTPSLVL